MDWWYWLTVTAAVGGGIAAVLNFAVYAKSKNKGHLMLGLCFLPVAVIFGILALR